MALANPLWGLATHSRRVAQAWLQSLERTVARLVPRRPKSPSQTWRTFLQNHVSDLVSVDFFVVPTATFRVLDVFVVLLHHRRKVVHFATTTTRAPTSRSRRMRPSHAPSSHLRTAASSPSPTVTSEARHSCGSRLCRRIPRRPEGRSVLARSISALTAAVAAPGQEGHGLDRATCRSIRPLDQVLANDSWPNWTLSRRGAPVSIPMW
jgi:hypothetical protein